MSRSLIDNYYRAFNTGDHAGMLDLLADDVAHDINQGARETGRSRFAEFLAHMNECYRETLKDIVVMSDASGTRLAAEFVVHGTYLKADEGLPRAYGQTYRLPAATFFETQAGKIKRVTTYYNLQDWLTQVKST